LILHLNIPVLTVYYLTEWKLRACKGFFSSSCV